ncbi:hypothetical protein [Vibrio fluvialis]|uniref:hypothetical protein n=1 Tax=Vibrio fluvialis TaxID=676 RepID=UPI00192C71A9|nr:hypothetical protein [Vibrio fluvialis]MBL4307676.1 hypothetical protein [Vibrio fluvialis]
MLGTEEHNLFEDSIEFPDFDAKMKLDQLIGLDDYKIRLTKMLSVLIHPRSMESWINKFHGVICTSKTGHLAKRHIAVQS